MEIEKIIVRGFRCIESAELRFGDLVSVIGPNNAGKSSLLRAIELFLGTKQPDLKDWPKADTSKAIELEGKFFKLTDADRDKPGVASLVYNDAIRLRVKYEVVDGKVVGAYECHKREEIIEGWDDKYSTCEQYIKDAASALGISGQAFKSSANKERVRQYIRENCPDKITTGEEIWTGEGVSIPQAFQQAIPRAELIPAVADATEEALAKAGTVFQRILAIAVLPAIEATDEYQALVNAANELRKKLKGETPLASIESLKTAIADRISLLIPASVVLDMATPDSKKYLGANVSLGLDDGGTSDIERQGHGLQRALVFAMLDYLAERNADTGNEQRPVVLLFEEPELYVHPQLLRRYRDVLRMIGQRAGWQVVLTTHSPVMVDVGHDPMGLAIMRRSSPVVAPILHQLRIDPFGEDVEERERLRATLDFDPTRAEAFFATDVVLVEGDSEIAVFQGGVEWHKVAGVGVLRRADLAMINCGGKWTIPAFARVLTYFGIPFRVVHDLDAKGRTPEELQAATALDPYKANAKIQSEIQRALEADLLASKYEVPDTFEDILWDAPPSPYDKPFRAWQRARFLADHPNEISEQLKAVLRFVFGVTEDAAGDTNEGVN